MILRSWWKVTQQLYDTVDTYIRGTTGKRLELPEPFSTSRSCNRNNESDYYNNRMFYNKYAVVGCWILMFSTPLTPHPTRRIFSDTTCILAFLRSFEVVDLTWMRSPEYRAAFKAVDDSGGIYNFRWGDAPIRTLLVLGLLPLDQIHHFRVVGCACCMNRDI